jgi:hypothetical protein
MAVLVIHHFEEMWDAGLNKFGTDIEVELSKIMDFLDNNKDNLDEVIMSFYDVDEVEWQQVRIEEFCREEGIQFRRFEYGYGWTKDQYDYDPDQISEENRGITWCDATRPYYDEGDGHILEIDPWHHSLKDKKVHLVGAFADECLDDMHTVLKTVGADVAYVEDICVGMAGNYQFSYGGLTEGQMSEKLNALGRAVEEGVDEDRDINGDFEALKTFLSNNKRYAQDFFHLNWHGKSAELFDDLAEFINSGFDDSCITFLDDYQPAMQMS